MEFLPIRAYDNYVEANMQRSLLEAADITCYIKDEYTLTIDPLLNIPLGGMKLMVDSVQFNHAEEVLDEAYARYLQTIPCPFCGKPELRKESETIIFANFIDRLKSMLVNGTSQQVKSCFRCGNCHLEFKDLPLPE